MAEHEWDVVFDDEFHAEFDAFHDAVQDKILARAGLLRQYGPQLPRPYADTLAGSAHSNMKELRAPVGTQVWRVAYAFDPAPRAILLCAGNKEGKGQKSFYERLIAVADKRFAKIRVILMKGDASMPKSLSDVMRNLAPERRARIEAETARESTQVMTLRELRKAFRMSQETVARELGMEQESISRLEHRTDLLLSTMRKYVAAMGGELKLIAEFPDCSPVQIETFADFEEKQEETAPPRKGVGPHGLS